MKKITEQQAEQVREALKTGLGVDRIAKKMGVSTYTIRNIRDGRWRPREPKLSTASPVTMRDVRRCPVHGVLVSWPCKICSIGDEWVQIKLAKGLRGLPPLEYIPKPKQDGMDEVCSECGSGPSQITGRGIYCTNCGEYWFPSPTLEQIAERSTKILRECTNLLER